MFLIFARIIKILYRTNVFFFFIPMQEGEVYCLCIHCYQFKTNILSEDSLFSCLPDSYLNMYTLL